LYHQGKVENISSKAMLCSRFFGWFRRKPKLQVELKHIIRYSDGTEKELTEEEAYKETGCRITIKQVK
jgi:hypothetical protein